MMSQAVFTALRKTIAELIHCEEDDVSLDARLTEDLGFESIDFLELAMILTEDFGVDVDDQAAFLADFRTLIRRGSREEILERLARAYPHLPPEDLARMLEMAPHGDVLQVGHLVRYVVHRRSAGSDSGTENGSGNGFGGKPYSAARSDEMRFPDGH